MFDRFTDRARAIITTAPDIARLTGDSEPRTTHILLAMLFESGGIAGNVLRDRAVDPAAVETAMSACVEPDATLSELAAAANFAATWLGHHYAGTEHLLPGRCKLPHAHADVDRRLKVIPPGFKSLCRNRRRALNVRQYAVHMDSATFR